MKKEPKLRMHHIELCVSDPNPVAELLHNQLGLRFVGYRESAQCLQLIFKMEKATFVVTTRKSLHCQPSDNNNYPDIVFESGLLKKPNKLEVTRDLSEAWTLFCCDSGFSSQERRAQHVDSVFNVAIEVVNIADCVNSIRDISQDLVLQEVTRCYDSDSELGYVDYAVIKSCCGNVVHTLVQKSEYRGWFLPGFYRVNQDELRASGNLSANSGIITMSHFDHFTFACRVGESNEIMDWYERAFGMKRFITNRQDSELEGLVIGDDVGLRLKVMQFWKCSESGLISTSSPTDDDAYDTLYRNWESEPLKIVIAESLPNLTNTQIEGFIKDHGGPGIQHVGLHTSNMLETVEVMTKNGVKFRHPPPTYYTEFTLSLFWHYIFVRTQIGQLEVIKSVGENVKVLREYGILLDNEADVFDSLENTSEERYLMQIFTYPVFNRDTFFLEVIQRKGARGFGVGNVTALARSVNAFNQAKLLEMQKMELSKANNKDES
ncbi:4-hydroxyphenylpyruvate dioxygenase-like protein [Orchesella cincta]|uniref:4-hydroxyphenylpyruvate dioxygenase-like protein n=1 Tax=Orchesella cincta TaxID=48709 RepID=A0A1D2MNC0_ORCCI|nr:4-hydroxyphenylpyruvate dioxygenase-like protein [Orchesella cincta]